MANETLPSNITYLTTQPLEINNTKLTIQGVVNKCEPCNIKVTISNTKKLPDVTIPKNFPVSPKSVHLICGNTKTTTLYIINIMTDKQ